MNGQTLGIALNGHSSQRDTHIGTAGELSEVVGESGRKVCDGVRNHEVKREGEVNKNQGQEGPM